MRPVQQLYYDNGKVNCPHHGSKYIRFMTNDKAMGRIYWCCAAWLADGTHCLRHAEWDCIEDMHDADLEMIAVAHQSTHF